jgi:hypothetical protein
MAGFYPVGRLPLDLIKSLQRGIKRTRDDDDLDGRRLDDDFGLENKKNSTLISTGGKRRTIKRRRKQKKTKAKKHNKKSKKSKRKPRKTRKNRK